MHPYDNRPFWQKHRTVLVLGIALLLVAGGIGVAAFITNRDKPAPIVATDIAPVPAMSAPARGLTADEVNDQRDSETANELLRNNIMFYGCGTFPAGDKLTKADLVPNANVIVVFKYDSSKKEYVHEGDPRVHVTRTVSKVGINSDNRDPDATLTTFAWTYDAGVYHYSTYGQYATSDTNHRFMWSQVLTGAAFDLTKAFVLTVSNDNGAGPQPTFVDVATDTRTCKPAPVKLPTGFSWAELAKSGLNTPDA